ncbi:MAG: SMP-30/gluconolactonase/LRE family protein [Thermoleophilia bacterium]
MGVLANSPKVYELVASSVQVEQIATGFTFTEGPVWHPSGYLLFSDMPNDVRRKWSEDGGIVEVTKPANKCNGLTFDDDLNLIVCEHWTSEVARVTLNADGTVARRETIASHWGEKELNSPNDVVVKSDGSIWFSDPTYGRMDVFGNPREQDLDFQGVYRIAPDGTLSLLVDDFVQPNGLCFSPDEKTLYINDSGALHLRRFSVNDDGTISGGEVILDQIGRPDDFAAGICDGMKCDEQGNIWVTGPGGVWVVDPEGEHLGTVEVPEHTGNLNWGGPNWDVLYVPSSTSVYRFQTKVSGNRLGYMR